MGAGCVKRIGKQAKELGGKKALIVSGKSKHGEKLAEDIRKIIENSGLKAAILQEQNQTPLTIRFWQLQKFTKKKTVI